MLRPYVNWKLWWVRTLKLWNDVKSRELGAEGLAAAALAVAVAVVLQQARSVNCPWVVGYSRRARWLYLRRPPWYRPQPLLTCIGRQARVTGKLSCSFHTWGQLSLEHGWAGALPQFPRLSSRYPSLPMQSPGRPGNRSWWMDRSRTSECFAPQAPGTRKKGSGI